MESAPFSEIFDRGKVSPAVERESARWPPPQTLTPSTQSTQIVRPVVEPWYKCTQKLGKQF